MQCHFVDGCYWDGGASKYTYPPGNLHIPCQPALFEDHFPFSQVGYVSCVREYLHPWKLTWLAGKSPCSIGNTSAFMMDFPLSGYLHLQRDPSFFSKKNSQHLQLGGSYRDRACNRRFGSGWDTRGTVFSLPPIIPGDGGDVIVDGAWNPTSTSWAMKKTLVV